MSETAIKFENISKQYRLGTIGTGTLSHDLKRWWTVSIRGKEDPYLKIGSVNDRRPGTDGEYIWALRDINFEVKRGEVLGIIGKNGAGKSTLLKLLSRVTAPTTGLIKTRGRIASLLEVGTGFHPEMTGRENIFMNGSIMGMTKAEIIRKFDEIVSFAGIEKYIDTPVKRYSSGMTVRLGFAIAAHLDPEILVVDEVLAVGDAEFQKKAIGKMQDVSRNDGRTVLFVSHNMAAVQKLCNKGIVLEAGKISFMGNSHESIDFYLNINPFPYSNISNGIKYCHPDIQIFSIKINNSENNIVTVGRSDPQLNITIDGMLLSEKKMSFGLTLYDCGHIKLAIYSPGHLEGKSQKFAKGHFRLQEMVRLPPNMTSGEYILDISLHDPNIEMFLDIPGYIKLISKGVIAKTGLEFDYKGSGFLILG